MAIPCRLDKYLRDSTTHSALQIDQLIRGGHAAIVHDGLVQRPLTPGQLVFTDDVVVLDGQTIKRRTHQHTFMLNKPLGVTCSARDPDGKRDLREYLAELPPGVFPVGRLDRMTSGLLLFTSDGDLANAVLHPDHHTEKLYWAWLNEVVEDHDPRLQAMLSGIDVRAARVGGVLRAQRVSVHHRSEHFTELHIVLSEGKNRHVRRLCRALDFYLHALHRKAIGPISLGALPLGQLRPLDEGEVALLWQALGGRHQVEQRKIAALKRASEAARAEGRPNARLEHWLANLD